MYKRQLPAGNYHFLFGRDRSWRKYGVRPIRIDVYKRQDILLGESGDWEDLYKVKGDANRSNVFSAFFTPGSSAYVGDLAHVKNLICGHSYWTDGTWDGMRNVRKQVAQAAGQYNLDVWQSEWSMLGDNYSSSEFVGYEQASEMDIAFYMSKVIHNDLTVAGVSSWSYWTSMDVSRWGHKNRFLLISLVPAGGEYGDICLLYTSRCV